MNDDLELLALHLAKLIAPEELRTVRTMLDRLEPGPHGAVAAVLTWLVVSLVGTRTDMTDAILDLRKANSMTIDYIKSVVAQADQFQVTARPRDPDGDPHAG